MKKIVIIFAIINMLALFCLLALLRTGGLKTCADDKAGSATSKAAPPILKRDADDSSELFKILREAEQTHESFAIYLNRKALASLGAINIEPIIEYANKMEVDKRENIIYVLRLIGDPRAVPFFVECLKSDNKKVVESSLLALSEMPDSRAYETVLALLKHKDQHIQVLAIDVLCGMPDSRTIEILREMYARNPKGELQSMLIGALGVLQVRDYVEEFIRLYKSLKKNDYLREVLTEALGNLADVRAFDLLTDGFLDDELSVYERIRHGLALRKIKGAEIRKTEVARKVWKNDKEDKDLSETSLRLLAAIIVAEGCGPDSLEASAWVLQHGARSAKIEIVRILGKKLNGRKTAIKRLLDIAAKDSDEYVRDAAKYELTGFNYDDM
jgi:HEAT repeat protein